MSKSLIEVELRYKVQEPEAMIAILAKQGVTVAKKQHVIDEWFAPTSVRSMSQEEEWFDKNHGIAWRIRRTQKDDGSFATILDSKQLTDANSHNTFKETPPIDVVHDAAVADLAKKDYRCWLTIDKTRWTFASGRDEFEIVLDEIAGMRQKIGVAAGLEIEFKGEGTRQDALNALGDFAASLGLQTKDQFERSFTVESMQALADFTS